MPSLTELAVRSAKPGTTLWDDSLKGFGLRCGAQRKTWVVLIGSGRRQSIGHYPLMSLADARKEAKRLLAEKTLGHVRPTFTAWDDAKAKFLADCEQRNKPRTLLDYTRLLKRFPFGRQALADITPRAVIRELEKIDGRAERHHAFAVLNAFFSWCLRQHLLDASPMAKIGAPERSHARERVLSPDELRRVWLACNELPGAFPKIVQLLILTGQRRGEISRLEWSFIDPEAKRVTLPARLAKNGRQHTWPLGEMAAAILATIPHVDDNPYVFPAARDRTKQTTVFNGWSKPKVALDAASGVTGWTLHDLRRTVSSGMAALGIQQVVVEKLLNHVSGGSQSPIAQVYNRHAYFDEMREALKKWEEYLARITA